MPGFVRLQNRNLTGHAMSSGLRCCVASYLEWITATSSISHVCDKFHSLVHRHGIPQVILTRATLYFNYNQLCMPVLAPRKVGKIIVRTGIKKFFIGLGLHVLNLVGKM